VHSTGRRKTTFPGKDSRLNTIIVMRATLHQGASNTYYGQWPREKAVVCCIESRSIAYNEVVAGVKFAAPGARGRVSPEIEARPAGNFNQPEKQIFGRASPTRTSALERG
jgi:hypothetical protein